MIWYKCNNFKKLALILGVVMIQKTIQTDDQLISICQDTICSCTNKTDDESGLRLQEVDCKGINISETYFNTIKFTNSIKLLDLENNLIEDIPNLSENSLKILILKKNQIKTLYYQNFKHSTELEELDLSWNSIETISRNSFDQLRMLKKLDLSHNNLNRFDYMIFSFIPKLQELDLSWNPRLGSNEDIEARDFFEFYGVTPILTTFKINGCNLKTVNLKSGSALKNLYASHNKMKKLPELPRNVNLIDFSGNPVEILNDSFANHMFHLNTFYLNDMPELTKIDEFAFFGLPALKIIHLQNCKQLKSFNGRAFGETVFHNETDTILEELNLRGSSISTLDSSLKYAFENLKTLNLDGCPLNCNCNLKWLKEEKHLKVIGQCVEPENLKTHDINTIDIEELQCDWPDYYYNIKNGLIIFGILVACITFISVVVLGLRRRPSNRRHIGSGSPYARITIEPTCENRF